MTPEYPVDIYSGIREVGDQKFGEESEF